MNQDANNWSITIDPTEIKLWAEAHKAHPEMLDYEEAGSDEYVLRLDFPGKKDDIYLGQTPVEKKITWDKFFEVFNEKHLAFQYVKDYEGKSPDFAYKLVKRDEQKEESLTLSS